jgi:hypothetical protein
MAKRGLLIGINYRNTSDELKGCINDVNNVREFLASKLGYTSFIVLTDDTTIKPTRANILGAIDTFVRSLKAGDEGWFHFSGHGILQRDFNRDEESGFDSCIVPIDYDASGLITDDVIRRMLVQRVPKGAKLYVVLDACNSGTGCDCRYKYDDDSSYSIDQNAKTLPKTYQPSEWSLRQTVRELKKYTKTRGEVFCISGCQDEQTSADAFIQQDQQYGGALTSTLLAHMQSNDLNTYKWKHLLKDVCCNLKIDGYTQQATITSGRPINMENTVFEIKKNLKIHKKIMYVNRHINNHTNHGNMNMMKSIGANIMKHVVDMKRVGTNMMKLKL